MKKQAIMVMAHNNLNILKLLLRKLDSEYFDIFLHIDKKSGINLSDVKNCVKISKFYFYKEINVCWGNITMVQCEYFLMHKVIESNNEYEFIHLISGVDFPIKTNKEIYEFFHKNVGKEFVHYQSNTMLDKNYDRIKYYRFIPKNYRKWKFLRIIDRLFVGIQKLLGVNRIKNSNYNYLKGAQWVSLSPNLLKYLLTKEDEFNKKFKHTQIPDEIFIQTFVNDSKFKNNLYSSKFNNNNDDYMRYIDWDRGNPYTFKYEDLDILLNSNCMFARKFDETNLKVVLKLYKVLIDREKNINS